MIDTHAHLNDPAFAGRLEAVVWRARSAGVAACVVPAYDPGSFAATEAVSAAWPGFALPAYGIHPWYAHRLAEAPPLERCLDRHPEAVAVGEIGLDFSPGLPPPDVQVDAFRRQLAVAEARGLPVLVHCRGAFERMYEILAARSGRSAVVLHSFSGGPGWLQRFLPLGVFVGFAGALTRPNARRYHQCAREVPPDRFLVETDAPAIGTASTPASEVEPAHAMEVLAALAAHRGESLADVAQAAERNARSVFHLKY